MFYLAYSGSRTDLVLSIRIHKSLLVRCDPPEVSYPEYSAIIPELSTVGTCYHLVLTKTKKCHLEAVPTRSCLGRIEVPRDE